MLLLSLLVFTNLFLLPLILHPFTVCRHFIHIGHEPFHPKMLKPNSYEYHFYNFFEHPTTYLSRRSIFSKHENFLEKISNFFLKSSNRIDKKYFYPNLLKYTQMSIFDHDLSPFTYSFLFMYISYFLLTYFSSLVHVYRISFRNKPKSVDDIRLRAQQLIELSYIKWIRHALAWKCLGVIISHVFHVVSVKILMQSLFQTYGHFHLHKNLVYSSWNLKKNIEIIYKHEGLTAFLSGICSRMIYELGITLLPRLVWWPIRSYLFRRATLKSYFHASSIELYFIQCIFENLVRCLSVYLQIFARLTTIEIVNQMHEPIHRKNYPFLYSYRSWLWPLSMDDYFTQSLSIFFRQIN